MARLIIETHSHHTNFRMKGLSIRAAGYAGHDLCVNETGYFLDSQQRNNPNTAKIDKTYLVKFLKELHEELPFDSIKIKGHYEMTGEQLMNEILNPSIK